MTSQHSTHASASAMRRGFSLIELLVVITIIAVLAGMLLPTMSMVRNVARQMVCTTNLRQLQLANIGYTVDWDGVYVPQFRYDTPTNAMTSWWPTNADLIRNYSGGLTTDRTKLPKRLCCPVSRKPSEVVPSSTTSQFEVSYAMSDTKYYQPAWPPPMEFWGYNSQSMRHPGEKLAFVDALSFDLVYSQSSPTAYFVGGLPLPEGVGNAVVAYRHRGRANVAWYDGHVSGELPKVVFTSGIWDPRF